MSTLATTAREHRDRLMDHVEKLPELADEVGVAPWPEVAARIADEHAFLVATLIPHMETVETAVHPELDRLMSCRLGMAPLEREHEEIRKLIGRLGELSALPETRHLTPGEAIELNRVLLKLYSIVKVHLREESLYVPILEHNLTPEQAEAIAVGLDHASRVEL
ncbi:MAG: hemerythrin domain-containing protein [Candidatus Limnocylindrales bacterium]